MNAVLRAVGPNDFGAAEDEIMEIVIPLHLPEKKIFLNTRTGARFDSDGKSLSGPSDSKSTPPLTT